MGRKIRHPILERLTQALEAKGHCLASRHLEMACALIDGQDEACLRALALEHCRRYGLDLRRILQGHETPQGAAGAPGYTPVFSMASIHPRTGRWRLAEIERIPFPPALLSPSRFVTRMDSRALEPFIRLGAYLVVDMSREIVTVAPAADPDTPSGNAPVFAVEVPGEGLVVRLAFYDAGCDRLELQAVAPQAPPLAVPGQEPGCRVVGRVVWMAQEL